jgi:MFS family permease
MTRLAWSYGLVPEAMSMAISSILLSVYIIVNLKGTVFDVGIVTAVSSITLIPSLLFWGYLVDRLERCKIFIIISFAGTGAAFLLFTVASNVTELLIFVALKSLFYAASRPARYVLTIESNSRSGWERGIAHMELVTGLGGGAGLALAAIWSGNMPFLNLWMICGVLSLTTAFLSIGLVQEPGLKIERKLLGLGRFVDTLSNASSMICSIDRGLIRKSSFDFRDGLRPRMIFFNIGILVFALAGGALFTALPVFFLGAYSASIVFLFFLVKEIANTLSYMIADKLDDIHALKVASILRAILIPLLIVGSYSLGLLSFIVTLLVLALLGVVWAIFDVASASLFMELASQGRTGVYSAILEFGNAIGSLLGGYVALTYGFSLLFAVCSVIYLTSLLAFVIQFHRHRIY